MIIINDGSVIIKRTYCPKSFRVLAMESGVYIQYHIMLKKIATKTIAKVSTDCEVIKY